LNKQFVTYEIAEKLKGKTFINQCFGGWDENKKWYYHPDSDIVLDAPLWQEAIEWFLVKHKLYLSIERDGLCWIIKIQNLRNEDEEGAVDVYIQETTCFDDIEEAKEKLLLKALTLI
jgi:hypothetical protein